MWGTRWRCWKGGEVAGERRTTAACGSVALTSNCCRERARQRGENEGATLLTSRRSFGGHLWRAGHREAAELGVQRSTMCNVRARE